MPNYQVRTILDGNNEDTIDQLLRLLINGQQLHVTINEGWNKPDSEHLSSEEVDGDTETNMQLGRKFFRIKEELQFVKRNTEKYNKLTNREKEIIQLLGEGHNNPQIAEQLFISRSTVEQHRKNINNKLKVKSFSNLMRFIYAFNLI
ncbi:response regulator transcription factor [Algibacter miyuki]|uniref:Response regulator transcription factor n=1 Tax=Algibacter miyuki TaxID=1306933 RepID=A0ABV5GYH1_9FLAO|nr:LuxR C-terminal-related transcriptional regulator [Algibacter miyuki]MDN3667265.1 LuxR C-terminal-related transcriptional regulator [Algibacter miyuki]